MVEHPSRFQLMRHAAHELDGGAARALGEHLAGCADCRARLDEITTIQSAGRAEAPMLMLPDAPPRRAWWPAWAGGLALAAAAAAIVVFAPARGVREKGGDALETFCLAPGEELAARCGDGDVIAPGTRVMFHVRLAGDRHLALLGRDRSGPATAYFPKNGDRSRLVRADAKDFMSASIALDASPGPESFVLFVSPSEFLIDTVRPAVDEPSRTPPTIQAIRVTLEKKVSQTEGPRR